MCEHKKIDGENEISIDLTHYLNTFSKKPGALRNSLALKSLPQLKSIYDAYFSKNPKEFIEILQKNKENNMSDIINILSEYKHSETNIIPFKELKDKATLGTITRIQTQRYNDICIKGGQNNGR